MTQIRSDIHNIPIGSKVTIARTVSESDVYLYAGVTGDLSPNHMNEQYMAGGQYGHRIAHGALLVGLMSAASSEMTIGRSVSYGYEGIRFTAPVFFGDTITVEYVLQSKDIATGKIFCKVTCLNQHGQIVAVGTHIKKALNGAGAGGDTVKK